VSAGCKVILVYNTDDMTFARRALSFALPDGIIVRRNEGFDFGAWADVLRNDPALWNCPNLLFVNDSVIGPAQVGATLFPRLWKSGADLVGLIESYEHIRHFQSFFFMLNRRALDHQAVRDFWRSVVNFKSKDSVIKADELRCTALCAQSGLKTQAIYQKSILAHPVRTRNPTIFHWPELIELGFPYIKIELLRNWITAQGLSELRRIVADPELIPFIDSFARIRGPAPKR